MNTDRLLRRLRRLIAEMKATERSLRHFVEPPRTAPIIRRRPERSESPPPKGKKKSRRRR